MTAKSDQISQITWAIIPVGSVISFAGAIAPKGWELCDGRLVSGDQYQDLAKVLFGENRDSFNLPDYRERFLVGATGQGDYELDKRGGQSEVTLTIDQMPSHKHGVTDSGHTHGYIKTYQGDYTLDASSDRPGIFSDNAKTDSARTGISINNAGGSHAHENRPPFVALNYIIKY